MKTDSQSGQSLVELVVGITVGILFIVAALGVITLSLRVDLNNTVSQTGSELAQEVVTNVEAFANADWHNVSGLLTATDYYLADDVFAGAVTAGRKSVTLNGHDFSVYFTLAPVYRDNVNKIGTITDTLDPSTLLLVAVAEWSTGGDTDSARIEKYIIRAKNRILHQTDWTGPIEAAGPTYTTATIGGRYATSTNASTTGATAGSITISGLSVGGGGGSTNIDATNKWAWNDAIGWIDFNTTNNIIVSGSGLSGYASSSVGWLALDCSTTPSGDICGDTAFQVGNDGSGGLSGWAWNDTIGWTSFCGDIGGDGTCDADPDYQVTIVAGEFRGFAWNDSVGWIGFNCVDVAGLCAISNFKVQTTWGAPTSIATLTSSIFDTQVATGGASFNTVMWIGTANNGSAVKFQFQSSNNLNDLLLDANFIGPDGTPSTHYEPISFGDQVEIKRVHHNNHRYIRYKVLLYSDNTKTVTPQVDDIIINYGL